MSGFGLKIKNTTSEQQVVDMFELGAEGSDVPRPALKSATGDSIETFWDYTGVTVPEGETQDVSPDDIVSKVTYTELKVFYGTGESAGSTIAISSNTLTEILVLLKADLLSNLGVTENDIGINLDTCRVFGVPTKPRVILNIAINYFNGYAPVSFAEPLYAFDLETKN